MIHYLDEEVVRWLFLLVFGVQIPTCPGHLFRHVAGHL